ncbi:MAG: Inner membrane protein YbaL [bacterium ADurb.Bin429]|nr:MAG: Inner membrane protein YbaL [bacterium ADurb.Bin429]
MQVDVTLLIDIILAILAGWLGGLVARRIKLPLVVGYLMAGILIGPHVFAAVGEGAHVRLLASLGVVFLLFAQGVQISLDDLLRVRKVGLYGGLAQVILVIVIGYLLGIGIGWSPTASLILGFILSVTSTTVLAKVLAEREEAHTQYARVALAISITQDLSTLAMVAVLPALGTLTLAVVPEMGWLLLKAGLFMTVVLVAARTVVPPFLRRIAATGSRELFLISAMVLCLVGAGSAELLGLSLALGAFLAGMMIAESEFHSETLSIVVPLRDVFGLLFFVSLGMFFDPAVLLQHWATVALIVLVLVVGKCLVVFGIVLWAGYHLRTAIMASLGLVPISEYSFIIAILAAGVPFSYLSGVQYSIVIAVAIISVILAPVLMQLGNPLYRFAIRFRALRRLTRAARENEELAQARAQTGHVLVCGHGRVGSLVAEALRDFQVPVVIIDYDQHQVAQLRGEGILALYGDASSPVLLQQSGVDDAAMAVICLPDSRSMLLTLQRLRQVNADMPLVARGLTPADLECGYDAGAEEVVEAEFECGLELARHTLLRLGKDEELVQGYVDQVRLFRYRSDLLREVRQTPPTSPPDTEKDQHREG